MKPQLLRVSKDLVHSFSARMDSLPDINNRWHYHPEVELVYFKKGNGTQFIGDNISTFLKDDVIMVGANLPHYWQFEDHYFDKEAIEKAEVYVIHFNEVFWGETFLELPENLGIKNLLKQSKQGIRITGNDKLIIGNMMEQLVNIEGPRKIALLLEVLIAISMCKKCTLLSSIGFQYNFQQAEKDRINAIYNYSIANFKNKISLEEIAAVANVSPNSFCRYFKSKTRKTYSQFINEIRIGKACKLLIENKHSVKEISYECGFYNFASFHKYFKLITGKSPLKYQKNFIG